MSGWPPIAEPELLERLSLGDREFEAFVRTLMSKVPARPYDAETLSHAIGYPWARPPGSYRLDDEGIGLLSEMSTAERDRALAELTSGDGRLPVLAIGSNAAPEALERKFAHFPDERDRTVLALTGRLHDFDVGAAAHLALYGAMPATLFPSPGTAACATVLWVTSAQFTQLAWSELSYRLGRLRTRFDLEDGETSFDEVLVFVCRFGAFCVDGQPAALAAIPASGRTAAAFTQEQLLDAAAALAIGPDADAELLVRTLFESAGEIGAKLATVWRASQPFESDHWTPFSPAGKL